MWESVSKQVTEAVTELFATAQPAAGKLLVVGCSSSEVVGMQIGHGSSEDAAEAIVSALMPLCEAHSVALAAQCCEHLNRALIVEREVALARGYEIVSVVPQPKAGGAFATAVFRAMRDPVAVETVCADMGMDIGNTLIGMHLRRVAVPLRTEVTHIGDAPLVCAVTRPKFIGGARAVYA